MMLFGDMARRARQAVGPLVGIAVSAYFVFHAVHGDRGLIRWWHLHQDLVRAEVELQQVAAERAEIEHRVQLLSPEGLDRDLLDERARVMLGVAHPDEYIIPLIEP